MLNKFVLPLVLSLLLASCGIPPDQSAARVPSIALNDQPVSVHPPAGATTSTFIDVSAGSS